MNTGLILLSVYIQYIRVHSKSTNNKYIIVTDVLQDCGTTMVPDSKLLGKVKSNHLDLKKDYKIDNFLQLPNFFEIIELRHINGGSNH